MEWESKSLSSVWRQRPGASAIAPSATASRSIGETNVHMLRFLNRQRLAVDDGVDDLSSAALQQPLDRSSRDFHLLRCLLLMQSLVVAESQCLQFIEADLDKLGLG